MANDNHFILNLENSNENLDQPSQIVNRDRLGDDQNSRIFTRILSEKLSWTWKCWARNLFRKLNEICVSRAIKRFTIILFLVCAIVFIIIIIFGESLGHLHSFRKSENFQGINEFRNEGVKSKKGLDGLAEREIQIRNKLALDKSKVGRYGKLIEDYRRELFLGHGEELVKPDINTLLETIFHKIDTDKDGRLDAVELEDWIQSKVQNHLDENSQENRELFKFLDKDRDGVVSWKEYFREFLKSNGHSETEADKHTEDYESIHMENREKDELIRQKFRWAGADRPPQDNRLNADEFRDFRHPEQSPAMLEHMCSEMMNKLDRDLNGFLSEYEFSANPEGGKESVSAGDLARSEKLWREERSLEFRQIIDSDNDGLATMEELMKYVNPKNPSHARNEARHLLEQADTDKDSWLSLAEFLRNKSLFLGSKVVNVARNLHDEF